MSMTDKSNTRTSTGTSTEQIQDHSSALKLWRAVLIQAVRDASSPYSYDRVPVARWMMADDFDTVCGMAQLKTPVMSKILGHIIAEPDKIRAQVLGKILVQKIEQL